MLLSINALSISIVHRFGDRRIVDDVSLEIHPGEIVGVVGESGAGKSTVGQAVIGMVDEPARIDGGSVAYNGRELVGLGEQERSELRGRDIAVITQDPLTALDPLMTIGDQLVETIVLRTGATASNAKAKALALLEQVGIPDPATRFSAYPHQFSGGMRQRIVIALALSVDPKIIVADEPTTALDVTLQRQVLDLIRKSCRERGVGVLLITHNMGVIAEIADRVVVMRHGRVVEQGSTSKVLGNPAEPYTKALIASVPRMERSAEAAEECKSLDSGDEIVLSAKDLSITFGTNTSIFTRKRHVVRAVNNVTLTLARGETLGIVGESGSGKSTLGRCLAGIIKPTSGAIQIAQDQLHLGRQNLQMVFQDPYSSLNPRLRVGDIVGEALSYYRVCSTKKELEERVEAALSRVHLPADSSRRYPHQFSGGQRQRISIARALIMQPKILICDEPTSALDVSVQAEILKILRELRRDSELSMIFISHDLAVVRSICQRVMVMRSGNIVESGRCDDIFENPREEYTRALIQAMPRTNLLWQ